MLDPLVGPLEGFGACSFVRGGVGKPVWARDDMFGLLDADAHFWPAGAQPLCDRLPDLRCAFLVEPEQGLARSLPPASSRPSCWAHVSQGQIPGAQLGELEVELAGQLCRARERAQFPHAFQLHHSALPRARAKAVAPGGPLTGRGRSLWRQSGRWHRPP